MRIILVAALVACSPSGWAVATSTTIVADNVSTAYVGDWGRWDGRTRETNPLIGSTPSLGVLALDGVLKIGAVLLVDRALPRWARPLVALPVMMLESWATIHNAIACVAPGACH